jgi:hypothetical protein
VESKDRMAKAKKKGKQKSQAEQSERFLRAAEAAGADKSGTKFERALLNIVKPIGRQKSQGK